MKKFLCLFLVIIMAFGALVSCEDNLIDEANTLIQQNLDKKPAEASKVALDFYIISGEGSVDYANQTVANKIKDEFEVLYNTTVTMHFISADKYEEELLAAHPAREAGKISIALVNNKDLYDELLSRDLLVNLRSFYSSKIYGTLKKQISNLLPFTYGTKSEAVTDPDTGETTNIKVDTSYAVPNNHVFGEYEYILINKAAVNAAYEKTAVDEILNSPIGTEQERAELIGEGGKLDMLSQTFEALLEDPGFQAVISGYNIESLDDIIRHEHGDYEDIAAAQNNWYCKVVDVPEVTEEDVYSSCFVAIGDETLAERAMQIIYKINTDVYFRNLLQYGVKDINYREVIVDGEVVGINRISSDSSTYNMYLKYTGDIFNAYFCLDNEGVCIFCTEDSDDCDHIYWVSENYENCKAHVSNVKNKAD